MLTHSWTTRHQVRNGLPAAAAVHSEAKPTGNFITRKSTSVMLTCLTLLKPSWDVCDWKQQPCKSTAPGLRQLPAAFHSSAEGTRCCPCESWHTWTTRKVVDL